MRQYKIAGFLMCSLLSLGGSDVLASTQTATIPVTVFVGEGCGLTTNAGGIDFGVYNPAGQSSPLTQNTTLNVICTPSTNYTIGLDYGQNNGSASNRFVKCATPGSCGTGTMNYNLYRDSQTQNVWGNVSGNWVSGTGNGATQPYTVYGKLPVQSSAPSNGIFIDTVTATLTF